MKRILFLILFAFIIYSCDELFPSKSDQKKKVEVVTNLQEKILADFESVLATNGKDTVGALQKILEEIQKNSEVEHAEINEQGIAIQYTSGMRGGLMISGEDDPSGSFNNFPPTEKSASVKSGIISEKGISNKSVISLTTAYENKPKGKKTIFINPHYNDRTQYANKILEQENYWFPKCGYDAPEKFLNNNAKVEVFTNLEKYGIVHLYTHGWAWPNNRAITDVYIMTGETENENTTKKYWDEIKNGNIPLVITNDHGNHYFLSPDFITKYNDFSENKTFFYGGFCYSFLGGWPSAINDDANALAYTGFTWHVRTDYNASWAQFLVFRMFDFKQPSPMILEDWFTKTNADIAKKYFDNDPECMKDVNIYYSGTSDLVFWEPANIDPATFNGEIDKEYNWKIVYSDLPQDYYIEWDMGDGNTKTKVENKLEFKYTYTKAGNFNITAVLYNKANNQSTAQAKATATIKDPNSKSQSFGYSWKIPQRTYWPRYDLNCTLSGSVEGSSGNKVMTVKENPYVKGRVDIEFSSYGPFKINFNGSFNVSPSKIDTTYADGTSKTFTFESDYGMKWFTSGFTPYTFFATSGGTFENPQSFGSIELWGYCTSKLEEFDKDKKLINKTTGTSTWILMSIHIDQQ